MFRVNICQPHVWGIIPKSKPLRKVAILVDDEPYIVEQIRFYPCFGVEDGVATEVDGLLIGREEFEVNTGQSMPKPGDRFWIACYKRFIGRMHNLKKREIYAGS